MSSGTQGAVQPDLMVTPQEMPRGSVMAYPMGEAKLEPLRVDFDRRVKLEFHGSDISSTGGLLPYRELDHALGLTELGGEVLSETRHGKNTRHLLVGLLRQSVFGRLAGYAQRLSHDPVMRAIVDKKGLERSAASSSQMGRFETEWLATDDNLAALTALSGVWVDRVHDRRPPKMIVLDMDSSISPTHGGQEGTAYNGHFGCSCYHPLFVFNQFGDLERCALRPGNVHSADGWCEVLEPVVSRGSFAIADADRPENNLYNADLGSGALLHRGIYPLSLAVHLLGVPDRILSDAIIGDTGVDEEIAILLRYDGGALAELHASTRTNAANDCWILGTQGRIHLHAPIYRPYRMTVTPVRARAKGDGGGSRLEGLKEGGLVQGAYQRFGHLASPLLNRKSKTRTLPYGGNGYHYEADAVRRAVEAGQLESDVMPLSESIRIMEMMDDIRAQWRAQGGDIGAERRRELG